MSAARLAKIISGITSPFIVGALFPLITIAAYSPTFSKFAVWGGLFLLFAVLVPFAYVYLQVRSGKVSDLHVAIREQRAVPFLVATLSTFVLALLFRALHVPRELLAAIATLVVNGIVFSVITRQWKISIHAASFVGSALLVGILVNSRWFWILLLLPAIVWSRVLRGRHDGWQAAAGALVIVMTTLFVFRLFALI